MWAPVTIKYNYISKNSQKLLALLLVVTTLFEISHININYLRVFLFGYLFYL